MQELIDKLNELVESGTKKKDLEEAIGLPENSLSTVLKGSKEMPASWIPKVQKFLEKPIAEPEVEKSKSVVQINGALSLAPTPEQVENMQAAIDKINKDFGEGSVMRLGDKPMRKLDTISTGSFGLDLILQIGGLPRGRIVEFYGPESSGKTTIALYTVAEAQKRNGRCAFIDVEHAFDDAYAKLIGVNVEDLLLSQPDYGEQALEELDRLILSNGYSVIVVDSVAALVPKAELEGEMGDAKMALQARMMSQAMRKIVGTVSKTNTLVIFINQLRATINQGYGTYNGPTEITTGGNALKFYASVRLDVRKAAQIKDGDEVVGNKVRIKIAKSKVCAPFKTTELDIMYGHGINKEGEVVDKAVELGIIVKNGSWYSYEGDKIGQGRDSACLLFKDNPEMCERVSQQVKDKVNGKP
jgi:recombination protein RecA